MPFFVAAFAITWLLQLPAVLAQLGVIAGPMERYMLPMGLGAFGPLLAAVLVSRFEPGGAGVRALFRPLGTWRVGAIWYVVALGLPALAYVGAMAVYTLGGGSGAERWLWLPQGPERIAALIVFPIGEEIGWRGLALPRLQRRYGPLAASLLVGVGWSLWHIPMFVLAGMPLSAFFVMFVYLIAGSVTFSWIYNHTRASLLLAVLAHAGAHLNNPNQAMPGNLTPLVLETIGMCVIACAVVIVDRKVWRRAG